MIYTSYFASKKYNEENGVSIARYNKFWQGKVYSDLFPSVSLLMWYKSLDKETQKDPKYIKQYIQAYWNETISKLDPHKVATDLEGKVLLCYEKSEDFCHRHLIADWLKSYGYEIKEL